MSRGLNWAEIFKRRPDLEPPGYRETIERMQQQKAEAVEQEQSKPKRRR